MIVELGRQLAAGGGRPALIQACVAEVVRGVGKGDGEVQLHAAEGALERHLPGAGAPLPGQRDEIDRWLEEHRTALLVNNLGHDVRFSSGFGRERRIVSLVAVPLVWDGKLMGTLRLASATPQAFTHDDLRFASEAAAVLQSRLFGTGG